MKKNKVFVQNIIIGTFLGIIIGVIFDNIAIWLSIATMFGIARANYINKKAKN